MAFDIGLHEVCVRVGGRAYATSQPNFLGWIVYQILLPMVLRCARASRARELRYKFVARAARAVDRVQLSFTRYEIRVSSSSNLLR